MPVAVTSHLSMPAGTKIYMSREGESDTILDAEATNLYQQMTGSIMYCVFSVRAQEHLLFIIRGKARGIRGKARGKENTPPYVGARVVKRGRSICDFLSSR